MTRFGVVTADRLQLVVLGPNYGESIILGVPGSPPRWLVIDSLLEGRGEGVRHPVLEALDELGATPDLVLLTHAHADHAAGMARLIEALPDTTKVASVVDDYRGARAAKLRDAAQRVEARAALRLIRQLKSSRRWGVESSRERLGDAMLTILHPTAQRSRELLADASAHPNLLSSPVRVDWRGRSILLAADLERDEWEALGPPGTYGGCDPAKVPHHGSPGAFDEVWADAKPAVPSSRTLVVTPFNRKPKLPDFDHSRGLPGLLDRVERVYLTCPPFQPLAPLAGPTSIADVRAARDGAAGARPTIPRQLGSIGPPDADYRAARGWIRVELSEDGTCEVVYGPASIAIGL